MTQALAILVGYLFGSIPFALLVSRGVAGVDVRRAGSGNVGSANVLRTSGVATALLVTVLDMAKGAGPVLLADRWSTAGSAPAVAGLAAIVGHVYPIWLRFHGGKGVATACGVFAVLTPWAALPAFALFVATVWATRLVSLGSLVAALALGPIAYALAAPPASWLAAAGAAILIVFRLRSNIARLRAGTERRIGQRARS